MMFGYKTITIQRSIDSITTGRDSTYIQVVGNNVKKVLKDYLEILKSLEVK